MTTLDRLDVLGWSRARDAEWGEVVDTLGHTGIDADALVPARIAVEHRGFYDVFGLDGEPTSLVEGAAVTAPLRRSIESPTGFPAVGDWVAVEPAAGANDSHSIHAVLERRSLFVRRAPGRDPRPQVVGANIDTVFIVSSLDGDLNPRRLERYLAVVMGGGATPVVILSKADGVEDTVGAENLVRGVAPDVEIVVSSAVDGRGIDRVRRLVTAGSTAAFVGSSGVGKSSLVNALVDEEIQEVAETQKDGRGRHTTIRRDLIPLTSASGEPRGLLVDTPGMREVQLWDGAGLDAVYVEIAEAAEQCRFSDCAHLDEPDCAVKAGLANGDIDPDRLEGMRRLLEELQDLDDEIERRRRARRDPRR